MKHIIEPKISLDYTPDNWSVREDSLDFAPRRLVGTRYQVDIFCIDTTVDENEIQERPKTESHRFG